MSEWKSLDELPAINQHVLVVAWDFGCAPEYYLCRFWQSTLAGQLPKFYLDESYHLPTLMQVGAQVRYWMPIPEVQA